MLKKQFPTSKQLCFWSGQSAAFALILGLLLSGCGKPTSQNEVTWEFEGDDVRVIEKFTDRDGDRRQFFPAAQLEEASSSGHVVTVRSQGETFEIYCRDEKQAGELVDVLVSAMNKKGN